VVRPKPVSEGATSARFGAFRAPPTLNKAGINLLRVVAQKTYNTSQLRETLHKYVNLKG